MTDGQAMSPSGSGSMADIEIGRKILHFTFVAAPIIAGLDKFFEVLAEWEMYLAPFIPDLLGLPPQTIMYIVGAVEIAAGLFVWFKPKIGAFIVSAWLFLIVINLLILGDFYDIALRDLGLALSALALGFLSNSKAESYE